MKKKILMVIFIVTSILLIFISYNFIYSVSEFKKHREYIKQPLEEQVIQDWMTVNYLKHQYDIDIEELFWVDIYLWKMNMSLKEFCDINNADCEKIIIYLETLR